MMCLPVGLYVVMHNDYINNAGVVWRSAKRFYFPELSYVVCPPHFCDHRCRNIGLALIESRETIVEFNIDIFSVFDLCERYNHILEKTGKISLSEMSDLEVLAEAACRATPIKI